MTENFNRRAKLARNVPEAQSEDVPECKMAEGGPNARGNEAPAIRLNRTAPLLARSDLLVILGVSRSTLHRWMTSDPRFPRARRIGPGTIRWLPEEVATYIATRECVEYEDHAFDPNEPDFEG